MTDLTVANTILAQLGGGRFKVMTGAKNFVGAADYLMFQIPTSKKINKVKITLTPDDLYTVEFLNINMKKLAVTTIKKFEGVFCDMLEDIFTEATGLYTRF
ncbi:putative YahA protein [Sinorhizobium phage phiN3]|uniref:Putative YahA protein n=1 Tax=Sinorhizobium phage phiN3 TaxID=1647405 RepID=A0A0F6WCW0_9CAUD|nr:putative YahA protein [Sinorhizobium phage phiN3]AKF13659.1 putative YahA protein [Sinorhizobium phage phiN3]